MRVLHITLALALAAMPPALAADESRQVRITAAVANVRSEPAASAKVVFQLRAGDVVALTAKADQWYEIQTTDGRKGYVFHRLGEVIEPPPPVPPPAPAAAPAPVPSATVPSLDIRHDQVGCVVAGLYPKVDACLVPVDNLGKAEIHFRASDAEPWYGVGLATDGPCYSAFLPKPQRTTTEFQYYVAAVDRSFAEHLRPEAGPAAPYHVRVVKNDRDCGSMARLAYSAKKLAKPILVAIARDPMGRALTAGAVEMMAAHALLAGFAQEGVILASSAAASAGTAGTAAAGAGGGGTGGGIGTTTIAIAGGAVVAAAVVAKAASGGGNKSNTPTSSGTGGGGGGGGATPTPTPTPTPAATLTGNWAGTETGTGRATGSGLDITVNCNTTLSGPFQQTGTTLTGTLTYGQWTCSPSDGVSFVPANGSAAALNGTASSGQILVSSPSIPGCANTQLSGTYTATTMDFTSAFQCNIEGLNVNVNAVIRLIRQ
jgi:hypothetical protein